MTRRRADKDGFVYLLDDNCRTAWIESGITRGERAFTLPETVTFSGVEYVCGSVEIGALSGNVKLESVDLPSTLKEFPLEMLFRDLALKRLVLRCGCVMEIGNPESGPLDDVPLDSCTLFVPGHLVQEYRRHPQWGRFSSVESI